MDKYLRSGSSFLQWVHGVHYTLWLSEANAIEYVHFTFGIYEVGKPTNVGICSDVIDVLQALDDQLKFELWRLRWRFHGRLESLSKSFISSHFHIKQFIYSFQFHLISLDFVFGVEVDWIETLVFFVSLNGLSNLERVSCLTIINSPINLSR